MLNSIAWIEHLAAFERTPLESARKPYVRLIRGKGLQFAVYNPENQGKSAKHEHSPRLGYCDV
ncbi:hypothetical protein C1C98_11555 [Pseudomonas ogarae]|uniref:Uncharacterized protein n=1 Tax=Pseudomonas ogarae (strain DSM 112162 / CECT 30235 / F113) TaxID=1114970 RepID=A0ABM6QZV6_PSEO1|nr:hypothetical protein C1C98_11555 [Pseudomonas ogarae]